MLQNCPRGEAIRYQAHRCLELPERYPGLGAQPAIRLPNVIAAARQQLLKLITFGAREHALVPGPWLHERLAATQPVGEMSDRERVGLGRVVFHDRAEIRQHQESRTL